MVEPKREAAIAQQQERQDDKQKRLLDASLERSEHRHEGLWHIPRYLKSVTVRYK